MKRRICKKAIMSIFLITVTSLFPMYALGSFEENSYMVEIEINPFYVKQDFDGWPRPGAADPFFKFNIISHDDDMDSSTPVDNDWFRAPESAPFLRTLFRGGYDIDIGDDELFVPFAGPVYIPKAPLTLPFTLKIEVWDNDFIGFDELMLSATIEVNDLPFEQNIENDGVYLSVHIRSIPLSPLIRTNPVPNTEDFWYWYEVMADRVRYEYQADDFDNVPVAILDTGIDSSVQGLVDHIIYWRDLVNGRDIPYDDHGHGTEVASLIIGNTSGVATNVDLIVIKIADSNGFIDVADAAQAIYIAVTAGAKIISMSFGWTARELSSEDLQVLKDAIEFAYTNGVLLIAASGNDKTSLEIYPAHFDKVISVSALMRYDPTISYNRVEDLAFRIPGDQSYLIPADIFTNYGTNPYESFKSIELSAPGAGIVNFLEGGTTAGTSFACPIVSAISALVIGYAQKKYNAHLNLDQIRYILGVSSVDLGPSGWDPYYGHGVVNAYNALKQIDRLYSHGRSSGPDSFGYTFIDSYASGGPKYSWIEISETGIEILPDSDDQWVTNIDIGFFFNFYGTDYSQVAIGNNGLVFSGAGTWQYINDPITQSPNIHGFIAPFWDDLVTWGSAGAIYYQTIGTTPNRKFVVEWYNNQHYRYSDKGITFEVILFEGTNNILFQYKDVTFGKVYGAVGGDNPPYDFGGSATVGIEDPTGTIGLQYSFNEQVITPGLAILFKFPAFAGTNMHVSMNAPASMDRGNTMTYTIYYNNFGNQEASNVVLQATLSPYVDFVSASDGGIYNSAARTVTWNISTVSAFPSGRGSRTITVTIPSSVPIGTIIQTTATVSTSTLETRYDDNTASAQTTVTGTNLPPNVSVGPTVGTVGGVPSVYWRTPITFTYYDPEAIGVDILIHLDDGGPDIIGSMTGGPPTWTFTVTFFPRTGHATVTYVVHYPLTDSQVNFNIYVDPAGYVYDITTGQRIAGAIVWLQRPDGQGGWENVPTGQTPPIMQPDINPQITGPDGQFQWDVLEGTYRVHVEAPGYYPADSIVVTVPPPVTDLHIGLTPLPPPPDTEPPITTLTIGEPKYIDPMNNIYVTSTTPFTLIAVDNPDGVGVASTFYRIYNNTYDTDWLEYSAPFYSIGLADGEYSIDYYSVDNVGNTEPTNTVTVILDNTPPVTTLTIGEPKYTSDKVYVTPDTPFTLEAADAGSGVFSTAYRIFNSNYDNGWQTYAGPFSLAGLADGVYIIEFNSTDKLGNVEAINSVQVTLFSWNYVFEDSYGRGTILKINIAHKFIQFITPDKDYGIRKATYMRQWGRTIIIQHCDSELRLITMALDTKLDFCIAIAWDKQTHKQYFLIDKIGKE